MTHVPWALKAFDKVSDIAPGETRDVKLTLDKYAVSYWEDRYGKWVVEPGTYSLKVGPSPGDDGAVKGTFIVTKNHAFEWNGL